MKVAVYCSSSENVTESMRSDARTLGRWIGSSGGSLVYGGIAAGLMGEVARSVSESGGKVIGVVPSSRLDRKSDINDENITVGNLHQRKQAMESLSDAFVALPGGYGTLDEVVSTWASLGFDNVEKPIVLLDTDGLYQPLSEQIDKMKAVGLLSDKNARKLIFAPTVESVIEILEKLNH